MPVIKAILVEAKVEGIEASERRAGTTFMLRSQRTGAELNLLGSDAMNPSLPRRYSTAELNPAGMHGLDDPRSHL